MSSRAYFRTILVLLVAFVLLLSLRQQQMLGEDEYDNYYRLGAMLCQEGYGHPQTLMAVSPHGYPLMLRLAGCAAGKYTPETARIPGQVLWVLALALSAWLCRPKRCGTPIWGLLITTALASAPWVLQAANTVEIDQAALPLAALLLVTAAAWHLEAPSSWWRRMLLALALGASLWFRLTTPILLLPPILLCAACRTSPERRRQQLRQTGLALLGGLALFLLTWWTFCHCTGLDVAGPFRYLAESLGFTTVGDRAPTLRHIALSACYVMLWGLSPLWLLAILTAIRQLCVKDRHPLPDGAIYLLCGLWLLCGYAIVGGALFGFPKYQTPALPLLLVGCARCLCAPKPSEEESPRRLLPPLAGLAFGIAILLAVFLPCDTLFVLRSTIRTMTADGAPVGRTALLALLRQCLLYAVAASVCAGTWWFLKRRGRPVCLALLALSTGIGLNLALCWQQARGGYCTGYIYGDRRECRQIAQLIADRGWESEAMLIPAELRQYLRGEDVTLPPPILPQAWNDLDAIVHRIETERPKMIVLSTLINPTAQLMAAREHPAFQQLLDRDYDFARLGHLLIWSRHAP